MNLPLLSMLRRAKASISRHKGNDPLFRALKQSTPAAPAKPLSAIQLLSREALRNPVDPPDGEARFDGSSRGLESGVRVPGRGDFALSTWLHTDGAAGWHVGDLVSQYESARRAGVGLSCVTNTGGSSSQENERRPSFYVCDGAPPRWRSAGRPRSCRIVFSFVTHRGRLFAAANDPTEGGLGRLFEHEAPDRWLDRGAA